MESMQPQGAPQGQAPMQQYYANQMSDRHRHVVIAAAAMIVLLVIGGGVAWWFARKEMQNDAPTSYYRQLPLLSKESRAKLPEAFPQFLVLGVNPEVINATTTTAQGGDKILYEVAIRAQVHPREMYDEYVDFLEHTDWHITARYVGEETASIVAMRNGRTLILSFKTGQRSTMLRIAYSVPE